MEILIAIIIIVALGLSANRIADKKMKSRYEALPKPPASIARNYKED